MNIDFLKEKIKVQPDNTLFRFSLGQMLFEQGSYLDAIPHLEFCCQRNATWMVAKIILGKAYLQLGKKTEAKNILEEALQLAIDQHHEGPQAELRAILSDL